MIMAKPPSTTGNKNLKTRLTAAAADIRDWPLPKLPLGGGQLIERGGQRGPEVAKTLQRIERRWVDGGFPDGEAIEAIIREELSDRAI